MDLDAVKDEVFSKLLLLDVTQLGQCGVQLNATIPANKRGKKTAIRSFLLNHLTSDAVEDHEDVEDIFRQLSDSISKMLSADDEKGVKEETEEVKTEIKQTNSSKTTTSNAGGNSAGDRNTGGITGEQNSTRIEVSRFREFKISNGTFGGEEDVDYPSLCYQIQEARTLNFSDREIVSGTIKAMKNPLRKYCEGKQLKLQQQGGLLKLDQLLKSIRSFANVKESSILVDEMKDSRQEPKESEKHFVTRLMGYRDNVMVVTQEEETPLAPEYVQKKFNRAVIVGFRKATIRLMLTPLLKKGIVVEDDDLIEEVNEAVNADKENQLKVGKDASTNSLDVEVETDKKRSKADENTVAVNALVLKEISKVAETVTGLKDNLEKLETKVNNITKDGGSSSQKSSYANKHYIKCKSCDERKVYCTHCNNCGKGGHKRRDCPDLNTEN